MTQLEVAIREPENGAIYVARDAENGVAVSLRGTVKNPPPAMLYHTWYSSLHTEEKPLADTQEAVVQLTVGSHTLTYVVSDSKELEEAQSIGAAGGGPEAPFGDPCVIHVAVARILEGVVSQNGEFQVCAESPLQWGEWNNYQAPDPAYASLNRIEYGWFLAPSGSDSVLLPVEGLSATGVIPPENDEKKARLCWSGKIPTAIAQDSSQAYELVLQVYHRDEPQRWHEARRSIQVHP